MSVGFQLLKLSSGNRGRPFAPQASTEVDRVFLSGAAASLAGPEEALVVDPRGGVAPSQMVEQKLLALLRTDRLGRDSGKDRANRALESLRKLPLSDTASRG
jgi:hypothetical protein